MRARFVVGLALGLLLASALTAHETPEASHAGRWTAECTLEGNDFAFFFESASGDVMNDDMRVRLARAGKPDVALPLEPAWYRSLPQIGAPASVCRGVLALPAGGTRVVLLLPLDARPSAESFSVALLDLQDGRVLDRVEDVGELRDSTLVTRRAGSNAIELRVVLEVLPEAQCDCREALIEAWRRIAWTRRRLHLDWTR